jgi:hypothetical protein
MSAFMCDTFRPLMVCADSGNLTFDLGREDWEQRQVRVLLGFVCMLNHGLLVVVEPGL